MSQKQINPWFWPANDCHTMHWTAQSLCWEENVCHYDDNWDCCSENDYDCILMLCLSGKRVRGGAALMPQLRL